MDLFTPPPATKVGESNARYLAYLANGMSADELRKRWKDGEFPELSATYARQWLALSR